MADVIATGLAWLATQRGLHMVSPAEYRRAGAESTTAVDVTQTQVRYQRLPPDGAPVDVRACDFLVAAASVSEDPQPGDRIEVSDRVFEVTPLGDEPCWRWTDHSHLARRIHTREVTA